MVAWKLKYNFTKSLLSKQIIDSVLVIAAVPSHYNTTYNGYTFIMPLTDGDTRSPLTLNSSQAKQWCSTFNSTLPRIIDESDQENSVHFIRSAFQKYELDRIQNIFINNINHIVGDWTWVNGQTNQGNVIILISWLSEDAYVQNERTMTGKRAFQTPDKHNI